MPPLFHHDFASPVGALRLVASDTGLVAVLWEKDSPRRVPLPGSERTDAHGILLQTERELAEYFAGQRRAFSVPLEMRGTPFQKQVWSVLQTIPYGQTLSYGSIAARLGNPLLTRAVGAANGRNPVSILVPCHRVVGANGQLTGFAGGLAAKEHLLRLESDALRLF